MKKNLRKVSLLAMISATNFMYAIGEKGIDDATSELAKYIDAVSNLIMVIGAIVGLVGAVRVYLKWNAGDQDVQKAVMGWVGACIFLVISGVVVKSFFGVK